MAIAWCSRDASRVQGVRRMLLDTKLHTGTGRLVKQDQLSSSSQCSTVHGCMQQGEPCTARMMPATAGDARVRHACNQVTAEPSTPGGISQALHCLIQQLEQAAPRIHAPPKGCTALEVFQGLPCITKVKVTMERVSKATLGNSGSRCHHECLQNAAAQ